jgi:regulatory protein
MTLKKSFTVDEIKKKLEYYCVYQDRCHKEVATKMKEYFLISEARDLIFLHLIQHNFLNEERFAKSFARGKFRMKQWGKDRIIRELKFKEISAYNIKTGLKEIDDDEYLETLYKITKNKNELLKETNLFKKKKKLIDFLRRKGYETNLIYKVVNEIIP